MDDSTLETLLGEIKTDKIRTEKCLTDYYKKKGYNIFTAAEYAQNNISNFVEFVNKSIANANKLNIPYIFSFASKEVLLLNNSYHPIKNIHEKLILMDWRDFELISSAILEICFGAINVQTTQATADGGLDFEGKLPIKSTILKNSYGFIEVYGQSKRYSGNVGIYDIKSFVAFANSKKRNYVHPAQLFMFFTSSNFAFNARKELDENGFLGLSGIQIASLIHSHKDLLIKKSSLFKEII